MEIIPIAFVCIIHFFAVKVKEGRLIQQGSYDELFNQDNLFKELVENQRNLERIIENEK